MSIQKKKRLTRFSAPGTAIPTATLFRIKPPSGRQSLAASRGRRLTPRNTAASRVSRLSPSILPQQTQRRQRRKLSRSRSSQKNRQADAAGRRFFGLGGSAGDHSTKRA